VRVVLEIILEEKLEDDVDGEDVLVHVDTTTDLFDLECKRLPWLCCAISESLLVHLLDEVRPRVADVGNVAVIGGMVDEQTDVVVPGLVGVVMVQLGAD
jgi:hypothetical protein